MKKILLGTTDITLSRMELGIWVVGGGPAWSDDLDWQVCIDTILEAHYRGTSPIDTVSGYNFDNSEVIVSQALKKLPRRQVVMETKCGTVWERKGSLLNKVGDRQLYKNLSPEPIHGEITVSLQRLGIDYANIYMTHWQSVPSFFTSIAETVAILNKLKFEGKTRVISVVNVNADRIREYLQYGELDIIRTKYSIPDRVIGSELLPLYRDSGIVVQIYSPLEQGLLTGIITRDHIPGGARVNKVWLQRENILKAIDMLKQWQPPCARYQYTTPTLTLAWILKQSDLVSILSGTAAPERVRENVAALNIDLPDADAALVRKMAEALER